MKRGEIYYVTIPQATGFEMTKTRPAVIVSGDGANSRENVVIVAFCSASSHQDTPTRVIIRSTARPSTVLCEHIYAVDKSRVSTFIGCATDDEMARIDAALSSALALDFTAHNAANTTRGEIEGTALRAELETYKRLYGELLDRMTGRTA
ncbi:MAG: type II toxin-antitoxin system PemK/MazF family toxin [Oscillospiraceae bacterium]|nr:type II toxin-antitoxin system PemK/MazF family toxin [Oscillospiraceae bacterium]